VRGGRRVKIGQSEDQSVDRTDPVGEESHGRNRPGEWSRTAIDGLVRLAYRFLWNQADAEDAVHEAAVIAHSRKGELRDPNRWWPWVCSIVVQQCHLLGRGKARRLRLTRTLDEKGNARGIKTAQDDNADVTEIVNELQRLPRRQREVLVLRHIQGMDFAEIGEMLGMSAETARVHAMRGRESLAAQLSERRSSDAM